MKSSITFNMKGPMVEYISIWGKKCSEVEKRIGTFDIVTEENTLNLNVTAFLVETSKTCNFLMSILVHSEPNE